MEWRNLGNKFSYFIHISNLRMCYKIRAPNTSNVVSLTGTISPGSSLAHWREGKARAHCVPAPRRAAIYVLPSAPAQPARCRARPQHLLNVPPTMYGAVPNSENHKDHTEYTPNCLALS